MAGAESGRKDKRHLIGAGSTVKCGSILSSNKDSAESVTGRIQMYHDFTESNEIPVQKTPCNRFDFALRTMSSKNACC